MLRIIAMMALIVTLILQVSGATLTSSNDKDTCQTTSCVEAAKRVLASMNKTVEPCDDFFEFACRGWIKKNPIPRNRNTWDLITAIRDSVTENLRKILEAPDEKKDGKPIKLARAMYRTCMDTKSIEKLGLRPFINTCKKLGLSIGPPSDEEAKQYNIPKMVGMARRYYDIDIFINLIIRPNINDSTKNRLRIEPFSSLLEGLDQFLRDPVRFKTSLDAHKNRIQGIMKAGGAGNKAEEYATRFMDFMIKVAKIMPTPNAGHTTSRELTIIELQTITDRNAVSWNWTTYLNSVFEETNVIVNPKNDKAYIRNLNYFKDLVQILVTTSPGTIARYIWWKVYLSVLPQTKNELHHHPKHFYKPVYSFVTESGRGAKCTNMVNSYFGMALTAAYVEKHFSAQEKKMAIEMWSDVSASFDEMLNELNWMDAGTKAEAHRKLFAMKPFVAFPDWVTNPKKLEKYYEGIEVFEGRLYDTCIHYKLIMGRQTLNSLRQKVDRNRWISPGTTVNAFYHLTMNSVTFPAAILHTPLYGNGVEALNYGAIGALMGHELTHGFDNKGRLFDGNGNYRQWWSKNTLQHYLEQVRCLIKQYTGYEVKQLGKHITVDGAFTQAENIADNGGLREALRAYKRLKLRSKPQQRLPGLAHYTDDQLFFLGFAQMWCGIETDSGLKYTLAHDVHAPNRFRVIGSLQNNAEFAKAWKCSHGSPMNPKHKCIVW